MDALTNDQELRCEGGALYGRILDGRLEVKCGRRCREQGVVVFHYFDLMTGNLVETKKYRDAAALKQPLSKELAWS